MKPSRRHTLMAAAGAVVAAPGLIREAAAQAQAPAAAPSVPESPGYYRFKVGGFTVTTVQDGFRMMPVQGFVRNAPLEEVQRVLGESFLSPTDYRNIFTATIVDTGRHLIVFDTGNGVAPIPTVGHLRRNMIAAGLDPARVTTVVLSHFHGDHVNGLLTAENTAAFPNAEVVVPEAEAAWWMDASNETRSPEGQRPNFANAARRLAPYQGRIRRIGDGAEVVPGVRAMSAPGHTPGHTVFHIADGNDQMMYLGDTTHRPELIARRPDFHTIFDFDAPAAEVSRKRVLDRVATDRIRVTGFHFPFPANGYMAKDGSGFRFVPADWASGV